MQQKIIVSRYWHIKTSLAFQSPFWNNLRNCILRWCSYVRVIDAAASQ